MCRRSSFASWWGPGSLSLRTDCCARTRSLRYCPWWMARTDFPQEWQDWLAHNVQRGCAPTDLFNTLVKEGFAPEVAERAINIRRVALKRFPSDRLELYTAEGFLPPQECGQLVQIIKDNLPPSTIRHAATAGAPFRPHPTSHLTGRAPPGRAPRSRRLR